MRDLLGPGEAAHRDAAVDRLHRLGPGMLALAPRDQIGVSVAPGMTVLTLMPLGASYEAKTLAIAVMPPFVAA